MDFFGICKKNQFFLPEKDSNENVDARACPCQADGGSVAKRLS